MAEHSKIEWCDHTFNPWIGCSKISTSATCGGGCDGCYAEQSTPVRVLRARGVETWGPGATRYRTGTWGDPLRWNKRHAAFFAQHGRRQRVFCASLADVFDNQVPPEWRADLFRLIEATPHLDWLLLTKRIGNAAEMMFEARGGHLPLLPHVWIGATVVNQHEADRDIPKLLEVPARVRFLSIEPMLGAIDLTTIPVGGGHGHHEFDPIIVGNVLCRATSADPCVHLVICGGESGPKARPMRPDWPRNLRDQCAAAGVPFLFKQHGEWISVPDLRRLPGGGCPGFGAFDHCPYDRDHESVLVGKKAAGRLLDGIEHNGFPEVAR